MKNAIHLDQDVMQNEEDFVRGLLKRFGSVIKATDGVISGMMIWRKFYRELGMNIEKEILDAFGINDLEDRIYGIKSVVLYKDPSTYETFLLFNVGDAAEEEVSNRDAAEAFAKVYAKLNSIREETGVKIEATITTDGIEIEASKDNLVYRIIIPKRELDASVDITIPIENALETAIKKMMD